MTITETPLPPCFQADPQPTEEAAERLVAAAMQRGSIAVVPWSEPPLDDLLHATGHDARSAYAERFWLAIVGPSSLWLLRSVAHGFEAQPNGFSIAPNALARALGLGDRTGRQSPLLRGLIRLCHFGLAAATPTEMHIRPLLPWLDTRQLRRLPVSVGREHAQWEQSFDQGDDQRAALRRASTIAFSMRRNGNTAQDCANTADRLLKRN